MCVCFRPSDAPAASDFFVKLLPTEDGKLTASKDATTPFEQVLPAWQQPLLYGRRVGERTGLIAQPGVNKFVVTYPKSFDKDYHDFLKHITFYGRLVNQNNIINLDMSLFYDEEVSGSVIRVATLWIAENPLYGMNPAARIRWNIRFARPWCVHASSRVGLVLWRQRAQGSAAATAGRRSYETPLP
jgi:hypothetical protein